jgi:hypothetical protein
VASIITSLAQLSARSRDRRFLQTLFLAPLFDAAGRKIMIAGTFAISGLLFLITAHLFAAGYLTPVTQTIAWFSTSSLPRRRQVRPT